MNDYKYNLALSYYNNSKYEEAMEICSEIIEEDQQNYMAYYLLGNIFFKLKDTQTAQKFLYLSLNFNEEFIYPYHLLVTIYNEEEKFDLAIEILDLAIKKFSDRKEYANEMAVFCTNMATIQNRLFNFDLGIMYGQKALRHDPSYFEVYPALIRAYWMKKDISNGKKYTKLYLDIYPDNMDVGFSYATLLLMDKEYEEGFKYYEYRLIDPPKNSIHNKLPYPKYKKGDDLTNKAVCIYLEQGYGDNIQFVRYLNNIEITKNYSLFVDSALIKLFKYNFKDIDVIDKVTDPSKFDYQLPGLSIPYLFDQYFVDNKPYLKVSQDDIIKFSKNYIDKTKMNIGIVWSSSTDNDSNVKRLLSLSNFEKLFSIKDTKFYSLQKEQLEQLSEYKDITDIGSSFEDFYDTAVAISSMDLIISIDTAAAHLTGALGQKGFVLHNEDLIDFRWNKSSGNSTWYESLEIIKYSEISSAIDIIYDKIVSE